MSKLDPTELNTTQDKEIWLPCSKCDNKTKHKVMLSINKVEDVDDVLTLWVDYEIVQCQGCETISFRKVWRDSDDIFHDGKGGLVNEIDFIYPKRVEGRQQLEYSRKLPSQIHDIYNETHIALSNKLPVLTGVGIRALIETVCKDKSATGDNLKDKIDSLVTIGVLTMEGAEILHSLRYMGNDAAHEVKPHKDEELNTAFDVVENLLESVYIIPIKAEKLPRKNTKT